MPFPRRRPPATSTPSRLTLSLLLFFSLNLLFLLYLLFPSHRPPPPLPPSPPTPLKPWPQLPSSLPWSSSSSVPRSCEAFFGNGFSASRDALRRGGAGRGWFRCHRSDTLRSSVCEGGGVRMDPSRIVMARGGERLEDVMGRGEDEEMPRFEDGAFEIEGSGGGMLVDDGFLDEYLPRGNVDRHAMRELVQGIRVVRKLECQQWIENPTLLVTRFEYANLFHTITDWYSAYVSSRVTNLPNRPNVVFVDGHCQAPLEQIWEAMFSSVTYAKTFTGPVCFRHVILSPLGYETAMFKGLSESFNCDGTTAHELRDNPDDYKTARLHEFGEMLRAAFDLPVDDKDVPKPVSGHNVLFVRREDYLAHPRHDGKVQSRLSNEQEVFDELKSWAAGYTSCKINLVNGLFAHMSLKDQLKAIQEASVVIGAHGAGLTHLVSARRDTVVLEIISGYYRRPHFRLISAWKGLRYHAINLSGSYAEPQEVVDQLRSIMQSLGC